MVRSLPTGEGSATFGLFRWHFQLSGIADTGRLQLAVTTCRSRKIFKIKGLCKSSHRAWQRIREFVLKIRLYRPK
jgi:hypothetical protein